LETIEDAAAEMPLTWDTIAAGAALSPAAFVFHGTEGTEGDPVTPEGVLLVLGPPWGIVFPDERGYDGVALA
jgi:hypothetical protein